MIDLASPSTLGIAAIVTTLAVTTVAAAGLASRERRARRTSRVGSARLTYAQGLRAGHMDRERDWAPGQPLYAECPYPDGTDDQFIWSEGYLDASHPVMPSLPIPSSPVS